jgi:hypothetical protein
MFKITALAFAALVTSNVNAQVPMTLWSSPAIINKMILDSEINRFIDNNNRYVESIGGKEQPKEAAPSPGATVVPMSSSNRMPAKLASHYPAPKRAEAERIFAEALSGYHKIENQFGIPRHDLAGAIAAFLVGSYMAYNDVDFPDANFKPLVAQMRRTLAHNAEFIQASNAEKQEMYERMAILGTTMALTREALKAQPNAQIASNMREAAKGYLEQFLKTDADKVRITSQGLVIR